MKNLRAAVAFLFAYVAAAFIAAKRLRKVEPAKVIEKVIAGSPLITSAEATPEVIGARPAASKVSRKVIVPARPDGGTQLSIQIETLPADLAEVISRATTEIAPATLRGRAVGARLRDRAVELRAAGQVRLLIWADLETNSGSAEIVIDSRALETLGATRGWADVWLRWATEVVTGRPIPSDEELRRHFTWQQIEHAGRGLTAAELVGWRVSALDLAAEVTGLALTTADQDPARWTSRYEPKGRTLEGADLRKLELADKSRPMSLECYRKDLDLDRLQRGQGLRLRWLAAGWQGDPMWRVELRLRGPALVLRPHKATTGEVLDLGRPTLLVDATAIARVWAHGVGHPDRRSGFFRLTLPDHDKTRLCQVDPRWLVVQQAAPAAVPIENLAQRTERRRAEREDYETKADQWLANAMARRTATEGLAADRAAGRALEHARRLVDAPEWADRYALALADVQDLIEPPGEPTNA